MTSPFIVANNGIFFTLGNWTLMFDALSSKSFEIQKPSGDSMRKDSPYNMIIVNDDDLLELDFDIDKDSHFFYHCHNGTSTESWSYISEETAKTIYNDIHPALALSEFFKVKSQNIIDLKIDDEDRLFPDYSIRFLHKTFYDPVRSSTESQEIDDAEMDENYHTPEETLVDDADDESDNDELERASKRFRLL